MLKLVILVAAATIATMMSAQTVSTLSEKWQKRLDSAAANYQAAVRKADNSRFYAVQKANTDRVKVLKQALSDATKAGDFDAATEIKKRVTAIEGEGTTRTKPEKTLKFEGHEYALIDDRVTWHVAKRLCEEMGGHLAIIDSDREQSFIASVCDKAPAASWLGASDEATEGKWIWISGIPVSNDQLRTWAIDDNGAAEHHLFFYPINKQIMDGAASTRFMFVCEFDT